ncbi:MAG: phosphoribosyl-ATP pyrophosphohydrolase [Ruminococcaceae bacterium]|nr:phosphoribosyl-ATP pyrophosphohydrolase [Oscillospiraceae bacterium]
MKRTYQKLVRDKIPKIIESKGEKPVTKILNDNEYRDSLFTKANEELNEVKTAESLDETKKELADLLEVIRAMAEQKGFSLSEIIEEADRKAEQRGRFSKRIFLIGVE